MILGWDHYRSFLAVVRQGSLSGAARELELTQPTLGRHIAALEEFLGTKLFTRSQQGLNPTQAALELVPYAEAMSVSAEALQRVASGEAHTERGTVRITASEIVGCEVLPPLLAEFSARHPGIVIELVLSNRNQDLLRRDADLAVRMVRPQQAALVTRKIGQVKIGLYAHRDYVKARGVPRSEKDIAQHAMIGWDRDSSAFRNVGGAVPLLSREFFAFRCDSDLAQLAALRAGLGIGGCQKGIARRDPALVPVLPEKVSFNLEMWLAMHEDLRASRRVKLLFDHLAKGLGAYIASQQGRAD